MKNILLSIDCGTQSLRGILYSPEGALLDKEQIQYDPYFSDCPGWAEQDPNIFWNALCKACMTLKQRNPEHFEKIRGMGVTTQRDSMICVNKKGQALRPVITWLDQRKARPVYKASIPAGLLHKLVGMDEPLAKTQADAKCNWIMQNQPEIWAQTHKYLQVSGYLNHRLTGEFKDSVASQIGHIPFNYKKQRWATQLNLSHRLFPVERSKLPTLVPAGGILGHITQAASQKTGLAKGTPVVACGSDKGCETIGAGVIDEKMASLSFGTTGTVQTTTSTYCEAIRFMPSYPAPIPNKYNAEVEIFRGFWMITWFKNEFAHKEMEIAKEKNVPPEAVLNDLLKRSPPGSMGLIVHPYWSPGLKHPSAKGAIIGFGDVHKKEHLYRAVIEGLCYGLFDGLKRIESTTGIQVKQIAVSGGASQSDEICQIAADIFNRSIVRGQTHENSGLGAAVVTAVGTGLYPDFDQAIQKMVHYRDTFKPNEVYTRLYSKLFHNVYSKLFKALHPLNDEIRKITGYPESIIK